MKNLPIEMQETIEEIALLSMQIDTTEDPRERRKLQRRKKELQILQMWRMDKMGLWEKLGGKTC